jgi:hypothetical protein
LTGRGEELSVFKVVAPQDGGWSLTPMENLLRGLRNGHEAVSLELYGAAGVVGYSVRSNNGSGLAGVLHSHFPQARLERRAAGEKGELDRSDWLHLDQEESALVQPLSLAGESYLPLRVFDDGAIERSRVDPLAGVIGLLAGSTRSGGESAGDRLGLRLVLRPAQENWNAPWQDRMQRRRDGEDRKQALSGSGPQAGAPSMGTILTWSVLGGLALGNWWLWDRGSIPGMVLFNLAAALAAAGGFRLWRGHGGGRQRPYLDEELVEAKLKSLAFWTELQIVRVYRHPADQLAARESMEMLLDCLRAFDDPAGNSWKPGPVREYTGEAVLRGDGRHPFLGGSQALGWIDPRRARRTALSAREVASLWHPPLGADEMASMERTAAGVLVPYLADLSVEGEDSGPLVGVLDSTGDEIRLPESSLRKHAVVLGRSGVGKSTMIKHVLAHKLERKAQGRDDGAIVVIDPHADLVREVLRMVPPAIAHKVRLLDFGRMDRVPGINLVDPYLFPDRDRCVDTIIGTLKHLWEHWGGRLEDLLKRSLLIVYEFNSHPETPRDEMLTMLDILALLEEGRESGNGRDARTEMSPFQRHVLSRVNDPRLKQWFQAFLGWDRALRSEAVGPVHSRIGAYASDQRAAVIMGQRESTIMLSDVLSEGLVLLVSTAQGTIGVGPAALMGGTMVSLVESALRDQESLPPAERAKCLLVCDEFQTVTGANWEGLLAEIRKYGCSLMLATQSLARLDTPERKLKAGVLGNVGCIVGYQMAAEDARIISAEMDAERVQERYLVNLDPHHCYVRINSDSRCYPAFSMRTLPPPDDARGSAESQRAVLEASAAYTTDWAEARARMNDELRERFDFGKVGSGEDAEEASPFTQALRKTEKQRVESGNLRGIRSSAVEDSRVSEEMLEKLMKLAPGDPGMRAMLDKRLGDQVAAERRKTRKEEQDRIREESRAELEKERAGLEKELEEREQAIRKEALAQARAELGAGLAGSGAPRDVGRLRRPSWMEGEGR